MAKAPTRNELPISCNGFIEDLVKIQTEFIKEYPDPGVGTGKVGTAVKVASKGAKGKKASPKREYKYSQKARDERKKALNAIKRAIKHINGFCEYAREYESEAD